MYTLYVYSIYVYIEYRKSNLSKEITLGGNQLNVATSCKYFDIWTPFAGFYCRITILSEY